MVRKQISLLITTGLLCLLCIAQEQSREYMDAATVKHTNGVIVVSANDPRPLRQALCAVRKQDGWLVDYEDPPYANSLDLVDDTDPQWRASHPNGPFAMIPAGGAFAFEYEENPATATAGGEEAVLEKMVSAYNRSGNPGKFEVRDEGSDWRPWSTSHKRYAIVGASVKNQAGEDQHVFSILDTRISIPTEQRSPHETIDLIARELCNKNHTKVVGGAFARYDSIQPKVTVGGDNVSGRSLLLQTLHAVQNPSMIWSLTWDVNMHAYFMNIGIVHNCN